MSVPLGPLALLYCPKELNRSLSGEKSSCEEPVRTEYKPQPRGQVYKAPGSQSMTHCWTFRALRPKSSLGQPEPRTDCWGGKVSIVQNFLVSVFSFVCLFV